MPLRLFFPNRNRSRAFGELLEQLGYFVLVLEHPHPCRTVARRKICDVRAYDQLPSRLYRNICSDHRTLLRGLIYLKAAGVCAWLVYLNPSGVRRIGHAVADAGSTEV